MSQAFNDVTQQLKTQGEATFLFLAVRHDFHVAWEVKLYHDCKTRRFYKRCIFS